MQILSNPMSALNVANRCNFRDTYEIGVEEHNGHGGEVRF